MKTPEVINLPFNEPDFIKAWEQWQKYRKERKLPKYVPTGLQKTLSMLKNISGGNKDNAIAIINQSIEQNYQGLFPLKNKRHETTSAAPASNSRTAGGYALLDKTRELYKARKGNP